MESKDIDDDSDQEDFFFNEEIVEQHIGNVILKGGEIFVKPVRLHVLRDFLFFSIVREREYNNIRIIKNSV